MLFSVGNQIQKNTNQLKLKRYMSFNIGLTLQKSAISTCSNEHTFKSTMCVCK